MDGGKRKMEKRAALTNCFGHVVYRIRAMQPFRMLRCAATVVRMAPSSHGVWASPFLILDQAVQRTDMLRTDPVLIHSILHPPSSIRSSSRTRDGASSNLWSASRVHPSTPDCLSISPPHARAALALCYRVDSFPSRFLTIR